MFVVNAWLQLTRRPRSERGAALVEYALLIALIVLVCLVAIQFFGGANSSSISNTASRVAAAG